MLYYRKKETNRKHYFKILAIVGVIILSQLIPAANKLSSNIVLTILNPINSISSYVTTETQLLIDSLFGSKPNREMVERLTLENERLLNENLKLQAVVNDQEILKKEYELKKDGQLISSRVIALSENNNFNKFVIDKGANAGIKVGDIVTGAYQRGDTQVKGALIGKVDEVYLNTSKVISIMDDKFNLTFKHDKSNDFGVINKRFAGLLEGYMVDKSTDININDYVLTSGIGGVYTEDIIIGKVVDVSESTDELTKLVKVKSNIDFNRIYEVFILKNEGAANE